MCVVDYDIISTSASELLSALGAGGGLGACGYPLIFAGAISPLQTKRMSANALRKLYAGERDIRCNEVKTLVRMGRGKEEGKIAGEVTHVGSAATTSAANTDERNTVLRNVLMP